MVLAKGFARHAGQGAPEGRILPLARPSQGFQIYWTPRTWASSPGYNIRALQARHHALVFLCLWPCRSKA